jgi:hypothetical protein
MHHQGVPARHAARSRTKEGVPERPRFFIAQRAQIASVQKIGTPTLMFFSLNASTQVEVVRSMAKKTASNDPRNVLRRAIIDYLIDQDLEEPSPGRAEFSRVMADVLEGLDTLDRGEVPPMFAPTLGKRLRNKYAAQIDRLRIKAILHVDALKRRGYKPEQAVKAVADAFGKSPAAIRAWALQLKKEPEENEMPNDLTTAQLQALGTERGQALLFKKTATVGEILGAAKSDGQQLTQVLKAQKSVKLK